MYQLLMIFSRKGNIDVVKWLVTNQAGVEFQDTVR